MGLRIITSKSDINYSYNANEHRENSVRRAQLALQITKNTDDLNFLKDVYDRLPEHIPQGLDLVKMRESVKGSGIEGLKQVYDNFHNKAQFDFKQQDPKYEDTGNFIFGFVVGEKYNVDIATKAAGAAQLRAGTSTGPSNWLAKDLASIIADPSKADDLKDNVQIRKGSALLNFVREYNSEKNNRSNQRVESPSVDRNENDDTGDRSSN